MRVSILIATYGDDEWRDRGISLGAVTALDQNSEIIVRHYSQATISAARNAAAALAHEDWLCFLDADDELAPNYISQIRRSYEWHRKTGHKVNRILFTPRVQYIHNGRAQDPRFLYRGHDLTVDNYLVIGTLIHRDLFMEVGGFSDYPHGFEDWSLWAKAWKAGAKIVEVAGAVYRAHVNPQSKHRLQWRDRAWQVRMHETVRRELFPDLM